MKSPKTIFCDLDGTLVKHNEPAEIQSPDLVLEVYQEFLKNLGSGMAKVTE